MTQQLYTDFIALIDGTALPQSTREELTLTDNVIDIESDGRLDPLDYAHGNRLAEGGFDTYDLKSVFDTLSISLIDGLAANSANTVFQCQRHSAGGGFQSGSNHFTITTPRAYVWIESITVSADNNQPAMAKLRAHLLRNGSTDPGAIAESASLTGTIALANKYFLGPVYIDDAQVEGVKSVEIRTGIEAPPSHVDGNIFATLDGTAQIRRKLEVAVEFEELGQLAAQGLGLSENSDGSRPALDVYLWHGAAGGGRTPKTGLGNDLHIWFKFAECMWNVGAPTGSSRQYKKTPITFLPTGTINSTNVAVDTTSFIPHA